MTGGVPNCISGGRLWIPGSPRLSGESTFTGRVAPSQAGVWRDFPCGGGARACDLGELWIKS
jgi:hypothetical protein